MQQRRTKSLIPLYSLITGLVCVFIYNWFAPPKISIKSKTEYLLENTIYVNLDSGRVIIELYPEEAPVHVARIKKLVRSGFYDGAPWHRVIGGVLAQCCDKSGHSTQAEGEPMKAEISDLPHIRGTVSMARRKDINSATSQFFITLSDARFLDGKYTVIGFVKEGIELIDNLKRGDRTNNDLVTDPDIVISMQIALDSEKERLLSSSSNTTPTEEDATGTQNS